MTAMPSSVVPLAAVTTVAPLARRPQPTGHVALRPAPPLEPPFDDEPGHGVGAGPRDPRLPFELPPPLRAPRFAAVARQGGLPDPAPWSRRLLVGLIECADGRRPLQQVAALLTPSIARGLGSEFEHAAASGRRHWLHRASVQSVRAAEPADGVAELCATLETGPRLRALAMRLEVHRGRWRCTRLQLG